MTFSAHPGCLGMQNEFVSKICSCLLNRLKEPAAFKISQIHCCICK